MTEDTEKRHLRGLALLAASVSHKLNNDLSGVTCNLSLVLEEIDEGSPTEELREIVSDALEAAVHATRLLGDTFGLYRLAAVNFHELDLGAAVQDVVDTVGEQAGIAGKVDTSGVLEGIVVRSTPENLQQMVAPLTLNALEAMNGRSGVIQVEARVQRVADLGEFLDPLADRSYATVVVRDDGPGFGVEFGARAFEPFMSTKATGRGLGLAVAHAYARAHGGTISYRNLARRGAEVTVWLPLASDGEAG
jgi:signal transduction histidine kinase